MRIFFQIIHLSPPNLACFAPWRESIPLFEYVGSMKKLHRPRKFSSIVVRSLQRFFFNFPFSEFSAPPR
jgi:hypothetical protein